MEVRNNWYPEPWIIFPQFDCAHGFLVSAPSFVAVDSLAASIDSLSQKMVNLMHMMEVKLAGISHAPTIVATLVSSLSSVVIEYFAEVL